MYNESKKAKDSIPTKRKYSYTGYFMLTLREISLTARLHNFFDKRIDLVLKRSLARVKKIKIKTWIKFNLYDDNFKSKNKV